jgi:hypothetical protein
METGSIHPDNIFCDSDEICPSGFVCGKMFSNPNWGVTNFDNIGSSLLMVFQVTTLEGWYPIMESLIGAFSGFIDAIIIIYFIMLIFIGNFFILNLTLAVIIVKFNESHENKKDVLEGIQHRLDCECQWGLNFSKMHKCGYFPQLKLNSKEKKKLENKLVKKIKKASMIKVNKNFKFKYKAKKSHSLKLKKAKSKKSSSKNMNEFIKGIRFQEDTHFQNTGSANHLSLHFSTLGKNSQILRSGNQSELMDLGSNLILFFNS